MKYVGRVSLLCVALGAGPSLATEYNLAELVSLVQQEQARSPDAERLAQARKQLVESVETLSAMLKRSGKSRQTGWKEYLGWEALQAAVDGKTPDFRALKRVLSKLQSNRDGLEKKQFAAVREALRAFIFLNEYSADKKVQDRYALVMKTLQQDLAELAENPHSAKAPTVGMYAGWLRDYEQAPELLKAIGAKYGHSNIDMRVSTRLISELGDVEVNNTTRIREVILGTTIRGSARTRGKLRIESVPSDGHAQFKLFLEGTTRSINTGRNRGVTIFSNGRTSIRASKRITFNDAGLQLKPSTARCRTSSSITQICARSRFIRRIASRQARKKQGQAESMASRSAERRVRAEMDSQARDLLADMSKKYQEKFRKPLLRRGEFPDQFKVSTTASELQLALRHAGRYQLAAPTRPPEMEGKHDASLRIHHSLIGNLSEPFWGGYTLTDQKLVAILEENEIEIPKELKVGRDRWSITFADRQPIQVFFEDDSFTVAINLKRIRSPRRLPFAFKIAAKYGIEQKDGRTIIKRDGDVVVTYPGRTRVSARQVAAGRFLRSKFRALFKEQIDREGIKLPERLATQGTLKLEQFRSRGGWLSIGWSLKKADKATTTTTTASVAKN